MVFCRGNVASNGLISKHNGKSRVCKRGNLNFALHADVLLGEWSRPRKRSCPSLPQEEILSFNALEDSKICPGFEASIEAIDEAESTLGPFDGILGFSQGAAMVGLFLGAKLQSTFKFVIYVASFKSKSEAHRQLYDGRIRILAD